MSSIEETVVAGIVGAGAKKILDAIDEPSAKRKSAQELKDRLDVLEAERLVLTIEVRNAILRECKNLLPAAIAQAKGTPAVPAKKGQPAQPAKPPSPALLRLITRTVMRNVNLEPRKK